MTHRAFSLLAAFATAVGPSVAWAQTTPLPVVGYLNSSSPRAHTRNYEAYRRRLADAGFVEGRNVVIEQRWANGDYAKLPALAAELVRAQVALIVAGGPPAARAAKAATSTIPIVFTSGEDPVKAGFVASLARPGGNITGITFIADGLAAKRLDFVRELIPGADLIALLVNRTPEGAAHTKPTQEAASQMGKQLAVLEAGTLAEIDTAFESAARQKAGAILIAADPFLNTQRAQIIALAAKFKLPTVGYERVYADEGGLMSYGASITDVYAQAGVYTGRILKGEKPADLPVQQPTKFEMVINLANAKALGLAISPSLLARADEVLE